MKILVTGGCGFIGSHVVDAYVDHGHDVIVIDKKNSSDIAYSNKKATYLQIDLTDSKSVNSIIKAEKPDAINHHAANISLTKSIEEPLYDADNNISAIINLLEAAKNNNKPKILFASSAGALYSQSTTLPFTEKTSPQPISPYGVSKLASENYIKVYSHLYGIEFVILRYSNIYGPRQNSNLKPVISTFIEQLMKNETPTIYNNGIQTRDFLYVEDLKNANLLALYYPENDTFNIASNTEYSIFETFKKIQSILEKNIQPNLEDKKIKEQQKSRISYEKAHRKLGWKPTITFDTGLERTIDWYTKNA